MSARRMSTICFQRIQANRADASPACLNRAAPYAHLNEALSSPVTPGSGRHPLPYPNMLAEKLGRWGIDKTSQVVVYDDSFGAMAARLWWLLRWLGHEAVAGLHAGFPKGVRGKTPIPKEFA